MSKIYTDHQTFNLICEYFNARDIDFDFIGKNNFNSHYEQIQFIIKNNAEKITFLLTKKYFIDLLTTLPNNDIFDSSQIILYDNDMEPYWSELILNDVEFVKKLNNKLPKKILGFVDYLPGTIVKNVWSNIEFEKFNYTNYNQFDGSFLSTLKNRTNAEKDFFYTVIVKNPFRKQVIEKLTEFNLIGNSFNLQKENYNNEPFEDLYQSYGPLYVKNFPWPAGLPPLTFYNRTNFELVFECLGLLPNDDSFHITEKILKPIAMKHPFVIASTPNFLKYLKQEGFHTFDSVIDESYDQEFDTEKRLDKLCESIRSIINGNSKNFYEKTKSICEYNYDLYVKKIGYYKADLWNNYRIFSKKYLKL